MSDSASVVFHNDDNGIFRQQVESVSAALRAMAGDPARCAMLVIDVQKVFCQASPINPRVNGTQETEQTARAIATLVPVFRQAGAQIYAIHQAGDYAATGFHHFEPDRVRDICVGKDRNSAFKGSNIADLLQRNGHDHLLACGFYLSACVKSTVLDARAHDYHVTLLKDLSDTEGADRYTHFRRNGVKVSQSRTFTNWPT